MAARADTSVPFDRSSTLTRQAWTTDEGLPDNSVLSIAQTQDGYLWVGTRGGLARFDGVRFVTFDQRNQPTWSSDVINALWAARDGDLFVGMLDGGLWRLRRGEFSQMSLPSPTVRALIQTRDATLWVAMDRGVARLRPGAPPDVPELLKSVYVYAFHEDPDGSVWLGTANGLYVYRGGVYSAVGAELGLPAESVNAIWRGADDVLWVGTSSGLYRIPASRAARVSGRSAPVWDVLEDRSGALWFVSDHGLELLRDNRPQQVFSDHGLSDRVLTLFEDREGSLWVGTRYSGVVRLSSGRAVSVAQDLEHPSVLTVLEDRTGTLWFATAGGGLARLAQGRLSALGPREGLTSDIVGPILEDREGRIWFGPRAGNRIQRLEQGRVSSVALEGVPASFYQDIDGALWVGTTGHGLYRLFGGQQSRWTTRDGLPSRAVRAITDDGEGGLWLGTPRGLVRFRGRPLEVYGAAQGLRSDRIMALYREPGGPLWVGTSRGGLARLVDGRITSYGPDQGLCDNQVLAILDDQLGNLWMSSSRGVFSVPKQHLNDLARGLRATVSCTAFGRDDGMVSAQCNGGYQPSGWRGRDGRLWFPTVRGLVVIDPTRLRATNAIPPPVWIEAVKADGQNVPRGAKLAAGTRRLEIDYTALSLVAPRKVRFRLRLAGFDDHWVETGTERHVSYTNLRPGRYLLQVTACNNDGVWNEEGDRWEFQIAPFLYQTAWFYGAVVIAVAGSGWGLHRLHVRQLRAKNAQLAERSRLSQEIHDHISQIMTGVVLQLDAASQTMARGTNSPGPYIDRASRLAQQGIEETRAILRSLRERVTPSVEPDATLDEALAEQIAPLIEGTGVGLRVRRRGKPFRLPADAKDELFHIGQEAVTNALRHADARRIEVTVAFESEGVRVSVEDDGRGFDPAAVGGDAAPGLGLAGMADRMARQHGALSIQSRRGGGTTVAAFLPRGAQGR